MNTILEVATNYLNRGWQPIAIPPRSKNPGVNGWESIRLTSSDLQKVFQVDSNIGVLNGEPSGNIVDIDLDHPLARELADEFLPPTNAEFGRTGSQRSHRIYRVSSSLDTKQYRLPKVDGKAPMIVELRSTGSQTIFPGSVHESGERVEWSKSGEPAEVTPGLLSATVQALATEVEQRLGIERKPRSANLRSPETSSRSRTITVERARKYLLQVPPAVSNQGGHDHTYFVAQRLVNGFELDRETALGLICEWNNTCQPPWSERELEHKIDSAIENEDDRGRGYMVNGDGRDWEIRRGMKSCSVQDWETVPRSIGRPKIDTSCKDLRTVTAQAWAAIEAANNPPTMFRYGGAPSRIESGDRSEPLIRGLEVNRMRHHLARAADWTEWKKSGEDMVEKLAAPPKDVVNDILATPDQPLPILSRIVEAPVFAANGTLQTTPGYHSQSQTFYVPAAGFSVPDVADKPNESDIESARELLCTELLGDFPFVGDAERAHALALLLLPFARDLIDGATPLHLFEKPSPGTGATLLVDMLSLPATGRPIAALTEGRDEDEWRKRITSKLRSGSQFILIDNLRRRLDSAAVSSAITAPTWEDRILGFSEIARIPVRCVWCATGNNPAVSTEIARRSIRIRMDARRDRPWLRSEFRHADLRSWATENRGQLVWAALTLIRVWVAAGKPMGKQTLGMFEDWAKVMGGVLGFAGVPGFLTNLTDFYEDSDAEGTSWRGFLAAWFERHGYAEVKVADLFPLAADTCLTLGNGSEQSQRVVLGKMLADRRDRVFDMTDESGEYRLLIRRGEKAQRAYQWRLLADGDDQPAVNSGESQRDTHSDATQHEIEQNLFEDNDLYE